MGAALLVGALGSLTLAGCSFDVFLSPAERACKEERRKEAKAWNAYADGFVGMTRKIHQSDDPYYWETVQYARACAREAGEGGPPSHDYCIRSARPPKGYGHLSDLDAYERTSPTVEEAAELTKLYNQARAATKRRAPVCKEPEFSP